MLGYLHILDVDLTLGENLTVVSQLGDLIVEVGEVVPEPQATPFDPSPRAQAVHDPHQVEYVPGGWPADLSTATPLSTTTSLFDSDSTPFPSDVVTPPEVNNPLDTNATQGQESGVELEDDQAQPQTQPEEPAEPKVAHMRILVSSNILATASPVFIAMFHGGFAEGFLRFNRDKPPTLRLPER